MRQHLASIVLLAASSCPHAQAVRTHCESTEVTYFNCLVRGSTKVASVCGAGYSFERKEGGYLQYRYGNVGNVELAFPSTLESAKLIDRFYFSSVRTADYVQSDRNLGFLNDGYGYSVYYSEETSKSGRKKASSGILVWTRADRKDVKNLACRNGDAGEALLVDHVVRLLSTPGHKWYRQLY
jgi:hypothetical protein